MIPGPLILKKNLCKRHIDTNATSNSRRKKLSNLNTYISTVRNFVTEFNVHVKQLIQPLLARGEMNTDLLADLFKGYKISSDQEFIK